MSPLLIIRRMEEKNAEKKTSNRKGCRGMEL